MKPISRSRKGRTKSKNRDLVLYVEDEADNREVARLRLEADYELLFAETDAEACAILKERGRELAAVLMDIQLQGSALNGIKLSQLIRGDLPAGDLPSYAQNMPTLTVAVIFVTAYGKHYSNDEVKEAGGMQLIAKPVDFVELSLAITRHHLDAVNRRINR